MKGIKLALPITTIIIATSWLTPISAQTPCTFVLGFARLRELVGPTKVGDCLEDEHFNLENGNAEQRTTGGLLVWRKIDNFTAFTDGSTTWVNGPNGLQSRPNGERFAWEKDPVQAAPAASQATLVPAATPVARQPASTPARPTATPTARPSGTSFGSGVKVVGTDIQPGTYRSNNQRPGCYWARLKGFGGSLDEIIANDNALGPAVVAILSSDAGFTSSRCADWVTVTGPVTTSPTAPFGDGTWIVGMDIAPGLWRTPGSERCYWERSSTLGGGGVGSIIANDNPRGSVTVQIAPSDKAFKSNRCGTWTKAG